MSEEQKEDKPLPENIPEGSPVDKLEPQVMVGGKIKKMTKVSRYLLDMITSEE